jgi:hypothetical protein
VYFVYFVDKLSVPSVMVSEVTMMPDEGSECWGDVPRLHEAVTAYLDAVGDGLVPDRQALLAEYADVAAELEEFFLAQDQMAGLTAPLRAVSRAATLPLVGVGVSPGIEGETGVAPDPRLAAVLEARGYELVGEGAGVHGWPGLGNLRPLSPGCDNPTAAGTLPWVYRDTRCRREHNYRRAVWSAYSVFPQWGMVRLSRLGNGKRPCYYAHARPAVW